MVVLVNDRYRILQALNEGGFGKTFLAEDVLMPSRRLCVIKQLKPVLDNDQIQKIVLERFQREAAILERIGEGHPQIPDLFAYFEEAGQFYLVQEWIEGQTLAEIVKRQGLLPEAAVIQLLNQILNVLEYIHGHKIIHRDIKPDNIIVRVSDQRPCLIDFGAVKEVMATQINAKGQPSRSIVIGTLDFMPREQAVGRPTFASDLYSLGLTAIYLLTGKLPDQFETDKLTGRLQWQQGCEHLSPGLRSLLDQLVKPHPKHRFATVAAMRRALQFVTQASGAYPVSQSGPELPASLPQVQRPQAQSSPVQSSPVQSSPVQSSPVQSSPGSQAPSPHIQSSQSRSPKRWWLWIGMATGGIAIASVGLFWLFRPQWHYFWGQRAAQSGDWPGAIENFQQALALKGDYTDATLELGGTYAEIGKYPEAITQFETVLKQQPTAAAYRERGTIRFATGDYQAAIADYDKALTLDPQNAETYDHRGYARQELGQYDQAIADYRRALRLQPKQADVYLNLASVFFTQGKVEAAVKELDQAIQVDANPVLAHVNRGSYWALLGDQGQAKQDWTQALELPVRTAKDYASRGYAKSRLGQIPGAIADYKQALNINPKLTRVHTHLVRLFSEQGQADQAREALEQALKTNPNATTAHLLSGELRAVQEPQADLEGALQDYDRALAINPKDPVGLNHRCEALLALDQLQRALEDCNQGLDINPSRAALYITRGHIRLRMQEYEQAIQDYGRAIRINRERNSDILSQTAFSSRASARIELQDVEGALSDLTEAIHLKPDAAEDYDKRGMLHADQGRQDAAILDLQQAADLYAKQGRTDSYNEVLDVLHSLGAG